MDRKNRIRILAAERNLSVANLATQSGIHPHNLRRYARQEAQPRLEVASRIANALGVTVDEVLGTSLGTAPITPPSQILRIPVFTASSDESVDAPVTTPTPIDHISAPDWISGNPKAYAVILTSETMAPRFCSGEILFAHPGYPPKPGDYVVVQLSNGLGCVKQFIKREGNEIVCKQLNPDLEVVFKDKKVRSIDRIVGAKYI